MGALGLGFVRPGGGGGANITPAPLAPAPGSSSVEISWPAVSGAVSYEVFQGPSATGPWTSKWTTPDTTFTLSGLSSETTYWAGVEATVVSSKGVVSFVTAEGPSLVLVQRDIIQAQYSNGNILPVGTLPQSGAIGGGGRTYAGLLTRLRYDQATNPMVYGVRFLLGNLRNAPISGGRMVAGWMDSTNEGDGWDGNWYPNRWNGSALVNQHTLTENPTTGWATLAIGGNAALPVRAATADAIGLDWTDWLMIPGGKAMGARGVAYRTQHVLAWRFFHPGQNAGTDYALTLSTQNGGGGVEMAPHGVEEFFKPWVNNQDDSNLQLGMYSGNAVANPASVADTSFTKKGMSKLFTLPGPTEFPFLAAQFLLEAP